MPSVVRTRIQGRLRRGSDSIRSVFSNSARLLCLWLHGHRVTQYSSLQKASQAIARSALKEKVGPIDLYGFDVGPCGKESAKPTSSKDAVGARKQIHDPNSAVLECYRKIRIQRISQSSSQHLGTHAGNGVLHYGNHFARRGRIHHQPSENPRRSSATKKASRYNPRNPWPDTTAGKGHEARYEHYTLEIPNRVCGQDTCNWPRVRFRDDHVACVARKNPTDKFRQLCVRHVPVFGVRHDPGVDSLRQKPDECIEQRSCAVHPRKQYNQHFTIVRHNLQIGPETAI